MISALLLGAAGLLVGLYFALHAKTVTGHLLDALHEQEKHEAGTKTPYQADQRAKAIAQRVGRKLQGKPLHLPRRIRKHANP